MLSAAIRRALESGPNYVSAVVYWEVVLKSMKGTLKVGDPRTWWLETLSQLAAVSLDLRPDHISGVCDLRSIHSDPFDRVLVAQATTEDMTLLTTDGEIARYATHRFRVLL